MFHARRASLARASALVVRDAARVHHRRRRLHRQQPRRPAARRGRRGRGRRRLPHRPPRVRRRAARAPGHATLVEGDVLDRRCSRTRSRAATGSSTCRRTPTCATASSIRAATSSRTRSRPRRCSRRCAPTGVTRIAFSSTGSVYGEPEVFPTPEDAPFPVQTSLYGASKLAGEGLIAAYAHGYGFTGLIFRFVSILGERYTHGHVFDFYRALQARPDAPARARRRPPGEVLPLRAGLRRRRCSPPPSATHDEPGAHVYNLGTDETDRRRRLGRAHHARTSASRREIEHTGGRARLDRRQPADPPRLRAHPRRSAGRRRLTIREAIVRTLDWFEANPYAVAERGRRRDERDLQPRAAAHLARRRAAPTCRPTTASTAASSSSGRSTSTSTCSPTRSSSAATG